jgi:hypothetical protein
MARSLAFTCRVSILACVLLAALANATVTLSAPGGQPNAQLTTYPFERANASFANAITAPAVVLPAAQQATGTLPDDGSCRGAVVLLDVAVDSRWLLWPRECARVQCAAVVFMHFPGDGAAAIVTHAVWDGGLSPAFSRTPVLLAVESAASSAALASLLATVARDNLTATVRVDDVVNGAGAALSMPHLIAITATGLIVAVAGVAVNLVCLGMFLVDDRGRVRSAPILPCMTLVFGASSAVLLSIHFGNDVFRSSQGLAFPIWRTTESTVPTDLSSFAVVAMSLHFDGILREIDASLSPRACCGSLRLSRWTTVVLHVLLIVIVAFDAVLQLSLSVASDTFILGALSTSSSINFVINGIYLFVIEALFIVNGRMLTQTLSDPARLVTLKLSTQERASRMRLARFVTASGWIGMCSLVIFVGFVAVVAGPAVPYITMYELTMLPTVATIVTFGFAFKPHRSFLGAMFASSRVSTERRAVGALPAAIAKSDR